MIFTHHMMQCLPYRGQRPGGEGGTNRAGIKGGSRERTKQGQVQTYVWGPQIILTWLFKEFARAQ